MLALSGQLTTASRDTSRYRDDVTAAGRSAFATQPVFAGRCIVARVFALARFRLPDTALDPRPLPGICRALEVCTGSEQHQFAPDRYSGCSLCLGDLSTDPLFIEKVHDIVGLYMAPPDRAVVLCVDEKSQI